jgi:hypothetical protein
MMKLVKRTFFGRLGKPVESNVMDGEAGETDLHRRLEKPNEPTIARLLFASLPPVPACRC